VNVLQSCGSTQLTEESAPVLPTLRFSRKFGLIFCGVAVFFKTCGLLVFWACFLQIYVLPIAFFNFMALLLFQFTAQGILGVFL